VEILIRLLREQPLLLLFLVAAIGYPLGLIRLGGSSLGVAAVLFVGLVFGSLDPNLKLPEVIYQLGLVLFVYTIGLSSGPGFVRALRRGGLRDNAFVAGMLLLAAALAIGLRLLFNLSTAQTAGLFAGSFTNTPALAGVLEALSYTAADSPLLDTILAEPVVGYSIAYPMGVLGMLLAIAVFNRLFQVDYAREAKDLRDLGGSGEQIINQTVEVTRTDLGALPVSVLSRGHGWRVLFSRRQRGDEVSLVHGDTRLQAGDRVSVIGAPGDVQTVVAFLGRPAAEPLDLDRSAYDHRRVFVSNHALFGRRIGDLDLPEKFGALATRVRRGDLDLLATADTVLEPGDRVRVVAPRERLGEVSKFFGDSYRALSEIDILSFSLGLVLGLILGQLPLPLPGGGGTFKLGIAGGPLIVSLALGALERTGPLVWTLPYSANLTLRQIGLVLFLAAVGTRAGYAFVTTLFSAGGILLFITGAFLTCATAALTLWLGHKLLRIPMSLLIGMLAGLQTQPAVLSFAQQQTRNDIPNIGYTTVYPVAMIAKIILAQLLLSVPV
jgi:putative transport protein